MEHYLETLRRGHYCHLAGRGQGQDAVKHLFLRVTPGCSGAHYIDQTGVELKRDLPALASQVLRLYTGGIEPRGL